MIISPGMGQSPSAWWCPGVTLCYDISVFHKLNYIWVSLFRSPALTVNSLKRKSWWQSRLGVRQLGVYLGLSISSLCGLGQVTVPLWASNEEGALINAYGSSHSHESSMDASDLPHHL